MEREFSGSQSFEQLSLDPNGSCSQPGLAARTPFGAVDQQALADDSDFVSEAHFGMASDPGGRPYQDDRCMAFSLRLWDGSRASVAAVLDGHHGDQISDMIAGHLPLVFTAAVHACRDVTLALEATVRSLDDLAFEAQASGRIPTGGTTLLILVLHGSQLTVANVGDCKAVLSSKGAPEPLSEAHNPPVEEERRRFAAAGVPCFSDHIGGSDINVCRTIGDYDLGPPIKWRENGAAQGPLISTPEITVHQIDAIDEFILLASDGLWDYYTPESSVLTDARRQLRACGQDPQATVEWLLAEALQRQRTTLHEGTPGDNVSVMMVRLRRLPELPKMSASRLNLRRSVSDADAPTPGRE